MADSPNEVGSLLEFCLCGHRFDVIWSGKTLQDFFGILGTSPFL